MYQDELLQVKTDLAHLGDKANELVTELGTVLPSNEEKRSAFMEGLPEDKMEYLKVPDAEKETKSEVNVRTTIHKVLCMHITCICDPTARSTRERWFQPPSCRLGARGKCISLSGTIGVSSGPGTQYARDEPAVAGSTR